MLGEIKKDKIKKLPFPKGNFFLGHYKELSSTNKHNHLEKWAIELGKMYQIKLPGQKFVVSSDPKLNQMILKSRPDLFRRLPKIDAVLREMGIVGVFNAEGEEWKKHRKLTAESLSLKNVKDFYPIIFEKSIKFLNKINLFSLENKKVDIQREFMFFSIEVTTALAFGYDMDIINEEHSVFQNHLEQIFKAVSQRVFSPIPIWQFYKRKKDKKLEESLFYIEKTIHNFIIHAKNKGLNKEDVTSKNSFLESLLQNKNSFTDKEIYGNVFTMLMAGEDSTSSSLSWILYHLSQHPEVIRKIREEAISVYNNQKLPQNYEDLKKLTYTHAVVQEVMRLQPTTTQVIVQSTQDCEIEGVFIPQKTNLILLNRIIQRDERYFEDAMKFIPERWNTKACPVSKHHYEVVKAFGDGPRLCPGMNLATVEMTVLISGICKEFDFRLHSSKNEVKERHEFIVYPENLFITFEKV